MTSKQEQMDSDFTELTLRVKEHSPVMAEWMEIGAREIPSYIGGSSLLMAFYWSHSPFSAMEWYHICVAIGQEF